MNEKKNQAGFNEEEIKTNPNPFKKICSDQNKQPETKKIMIEDTLPKSNDFKQSEIKKEN